MNYKNQGFVTLSVLTLLPIVAITLAAVTYAAIQTLKINRAKHLCLQSSLQQQINSLSSIQRLTSLNPWARSLRTQAKVANQALKAAIRSGQPQAIAAAQAYVFYIRAQQTSLSAYQKSLLLKHQTESIRFFAKQKQVMTKNILGISRVQKIGDWKLALKPTPRNSLSPSYTARKSFNKKQAIGFDIKFGSGFSIFGLKKFQSLSLRCLATINNSNLLWRVTLMGNQIQ